MTNKLVLQISAAKGPVECQLAVAKTLKQIAKDAKNQDVIIAVIDDEVGEKDNTYLSITLEVTGENVEQFCTCWQGVIQWTFQSPYRKNHKRKNWFIGIHVFDVEKTCMQMKPNDLKVKFMRAGGPGGQHANKTDSAVRITHIPTGISAVAKEERSQHQNKKLCMTRLILKIDAEYAKEQQSADKNKWLFHNNLERGNPVKVFKE